MPSGQRVHIVDDDRAVRDAVVLLLAAEGFDVRAHDSAQSFVDSVSQRDRGCVIADLRMPGISGIDLLSLMKQRHISMPVIIMTAHADVPLAVEAMRLGAVDFLEKPFDSDVLLAAIRESLARIGEFVAKPRAAVEERLANLTKRESEVLAGLLQGKSNKIIAFELGISARTVEVHRANLMTKTQASSLSDLIKMSLLRDDADLAG